MSRARDVADSQDNLGGAVAPFVAGKNQIINGAMNVWQRGTSFGTSSGQYTADRWFTNGETTSTARSTDAPTGLAYSLQLTANTGFPLFQFIELPATGNGGIFTAGSIFTLSFYAKASTATTMQARMQFADDKSGTNAVSIFALQNVANVTTSWARYSFTFTVANNAAATNILAELLLYKGSVSSGTTMKITGVQLEQGSIATPFTTASGSIGGELALCQRYYWRWSATATYSMSNFIGYSISTSGVQFAITAPTPMRITPTSIEFTSGFRWTEYKTTFNDINSFVLVGATEAGTPTGWFVGASSASGTPFTTGRIGSVTASNNANAYIGFNAEL